jgi:phage-related holin
VVTAVVIGCFIGTIVARLLLARTKSQSESVTANQPTPPNGRPMPYRFSILAIVAVLGPLLTGFFSNHDIQIGLVGLSMMCIPTYGGISYAYKTGRVPQMYRIILQATILALLVAIIVASSISDFLIAISWIFFLYTFFRLGSLRPIPAQ